MAKVILGKILMTFRDEIYWTATPVTPFTILDVVEFQDSTFLCVADPTDNQPPTDTNFWRVLCKGAYKNWLDAGNEGTQEEFRASLKGSPGDSLPVQFNFTDTWMQWRNVGDTEWTNGVLLSTLGVVPEIINGYWYINGQATGVRALAQDGLPGTSLTWNSLTEAQKTEIKEDIAAGAYEPMVNITNEERKIGTIKLFGTTYDLFQMLVEITNNIPVVANAEATFELSAIPLGFNLFLKIDSFIAAADSQVIVADYYNHLYKIQRIFVDTDLATKVTIKCLESIPVDVKINLQVQYIKDPGDILELNVTVPAGIDPADVDLTFPKLKYNKKVITTISRADGLATWQLLFAPIHKKWCDMGLKSYIYGVSDGLFTWHPDWSANGKDNRIIYKTEGFYPTKFLECTDGSTSSIKHRWAYTMDLWIRGFAAVALSDTNTNNCPANCYNPNWSFDDGLTPAQLDVIKARPGFQGDHNTWQEVQQMLDFGVGLRWHDLQSKPVSEGGQLPDAYNSMTQEQFEAEIEKHQEVAEILFGRRVWSGSFPSGSELYRRYMLYPGIRYYMETLKDVGETQPRPFSDESWIIPPLPGTTAMADLLQYRKLGQCLGSDFLSGQDGQGVVNWKNWVLSQVSKPILQNEMCIFGIDWFYSTDNFPTHAADLDGQIGASATGDNADILWVPSLEEFWEYKYMTDFASIGKSTNGQNIKFKIHIPFVTDFFFKSISCMLSGIDSLTGIAVSSSSNCTGTSFGLSPDRFTGETKLLVNLDFNKDLISKAEKYVSRYEAAVATGVLSFPFEPLQSFFEDAQYFVQMLKAGVREPFQARIDTLSAKPEISSLMINTGGLTTISKDIIVHIEAENHPAEMIISTNANFAGASWVTFLEDAPFALPNAPEDYDVAKNIYVQLRNNFGTSDAFPPVSITLIHTVLSFTELKINGTNQPTSNGLVILSFVYQGTPTHYAIRTDTNFTEDDWVEFTENPTIQLANQSVFGYKTVYAKLKNVTNTSPATGSISSSIMFYDANSIVLNSVIVNNGDAETTSNIVNITWDSTTDPTHYRISATSTFSGSFIALTAPQIAAKTVQVTLPAGVGEKTVYLQLQRNTTVSNVPAPDTIIVSTPVEMTGILVNDDDPSTQETVVNVLLQNVTGTPTHYWVGEVANPATPTWVAFTAGQLASMIIPYTLSSTPAVKNVYARIKRMVGTQNVSLSTIRTDNITLQAPPAQAVAAVLSFTQEYYYVDYPVVNGVTINKVAASSAVSNSWTSPQLKSKTGTLLDWFIEIKADYYPANAQTSTTDKALSPATVTLSGDHGPYPDIYLNKTHVMQGDCQNNRKARLVFTLPVGLYRFKILWANKSDYAVYPAIEAYTFYRVDVNGVVGTPVQVGPAGFTGVGNLAFNAAIMFEVPAGGANPGNVTLYLYNTVSGGEGYRPGINLLEIVQNPTD